MNPLLIGTLLAGFSGLMKSKNFPIVAVIALVVLYFLYENTVGAAKDFFNDMLNKVVITNDEIKAAEDKTGIYKYFTQTWYLEKMFSNVDRSRLIGGDLAHDYAAEIKNAAGFLNDDESSIYQIFDALPNKLSVGFVAHNFTTLYNIGLLEFLKSFMSNKEMIRLYDIVQRKPLT